MRKQNKKLVIFLSFLLLFSMIPPVSAAAESSVSQYIDTLGRTTGEYVKADALDGVTIRLRPHGSYKTVAINNDGYSGQNTAHLYYLGHSSRLFLEKAGDDTFMISFYQKQDNITPKRSDNYLLTAEQNKEGGAVHIEEKHSGEDAKRAYWKFIPLEDGSYQIYNEKFDKYWSLENTSELYKNGNKVQIKGSPMSWDMEIVTTKFYFNDALNGQELVTIEQAKRYDSYNIHYNDKEVTSLNWMESLPDETKLSDLNIPGTHDVATINVDSPGTKRCQQLYIDDLLKTGTRHFDLRFKSEGDTEDTIRLVHADEHCRDRTGNDLTMATVMGWCREFLAEHPGECLIFQIMEDRGDKDYNVYNYFKNLANQENSIIWSGTGMPTLGELRGKIYIVSRLLHSDLMKKNIAVEATENDLYAINDGTTIKKWALDVRDIYKESDKGYPADCGTVNEVHVYTQDDWSHTGGDKWKIVEKCLKPDSNDKSVDQLHEKAKNNGEDALFLIYTSCSSCSNHTPFDNAKEVHQKLFDASWYTPELFTGVLCNNFIDEHFSQLIWSSNFKDGSVDGNVAASAFSSGYKALIAVGILAIAIIAATFVLRRKKKTETPEK